MGSEYDYAIIVRVGFRGTERKNQDDIYVTDFDDTNPERFLSLKINDNDLPVQEMKYQDDEKEARYNNNAYPFSYWNFNWYNSLNPIQTSHTVYSTDLELINSIRNMTACRCLFSMTYGFEKYNNDNTYSFSYYDPTFLDRPQLKRVSISKGIFKNNNNKLDFRFSAPPFALEPDPPRRLGYYDYGTKAAESALTFVVIRFKNKAPNCIVASGVLNSYLQSHPILTTRDLRWSPDGIKASANGTLADRCDWPFPLPPSDPFLGYTYRNWGWGSAYENNNIDSYWGNGGHTFFDLCAFEKDIFPLCSGNIPDKLNITIETRCLGIQTVEVSNDKPLYYYSGYREGYLPLTNIIGSSYTNCGNFLEVQSDGSTYYIYADFIHALNEFYSYRYYYDNNQYITNEILLKSIKNCDFYEDFKSTAFSTYYIINKVPKGYVATNLGFLPNEPIAYGGGSLYEFFIDDNDYLSDPKNPVIPDKYLDKNGKIVPKQDIIQSWNIGDFIERDPNGISLPSTEDSYFICEIGNARFENKRNGIQYSDWPPKIKGGAIFCSPTVIGPAESATSSYHRVSTLHLIKDKRLVPFWDERKTSKYAVNGVGNQAAIPVNGVPRFLKCRFWELGTVRQYWGFGCNSCDTVEPNITRRAITVTP